MAVDTKTALLGALLIGIVAMAGWVGFMYVNPVTKTRTKTDEETEYIYITEDTSVRDGIPLDRSDAPLDAYLTIYNETGGEIKVYLSDILDGIDLYWEQDDDPQGRLLHEHKPEYMGVNSVVDPITGITFTGVYLLDILEFARVNYAWNISCKSNQDEVTNQYFNTTTGNILYWSSKTGGYKYTIVAIAANGEWLQYSGFGNFTLLQDDQEITVYDLKEVKTLTEWQVEIYVNNTLQDFKINRTNIIDPYNPNGWHYEYHKLPQDFGGQYDYNRTYWGLNMSYILNQTIAKDHNYTMRAVSADEYAGYQLNNTDVNNGLSYPAKYGEVNATVWDPIKLKWSNGVKLPKTELLPVLTYKQQRYLEYGLFATDPVWDKAYMNGYGSGPFKFIMPGQTHNRYNTMVYQIRVTYYDGPIP